jgi:hypothetical protein
MCDNDVMTKTGATRQQTTREYVEQDLGIPWATWRKMDDAGRNEAVTGKPAPDYLRVPAGPERMALIRKSLATPEAQAEVGAHLARMKRG